MTAPATMASRLESQSSGRIAGAGFGLDLTKRRLQSRLKEKGLSWERAKAFDGAALFSPFQPLSGDAAGLALELDVTEPEAIAAGFDVAESRLGTLTVLVNNAGVAWSGRVEAMPDFITFSAAVLRGFSCSAS